MWLGIITLFPEIFSALEFGITGRALQQKILELQFWNPRDFTDDPHRTVDDRPYGGGPGMVMKVEPLQKAIDAAKLAAGKQTPCPVIYLSPQGRRFDQQAALQLSQRSKLILVSGRYEGIDARLLESVIDEEWSIGDFVVSGGELPALCMIDAITRLLPNALGCSESALEDSFMTGLLDYPHYTRPEVINGMRVPEVLLGGNHADIRRWRLKQALGQTWLKRPDLLKNRIFQPEEEVLLAEFLKEQN